MLSVADQGLSSGANFGVSLLLARWLPPSEYGAFALTFAVFLFATGVHTALILEPMAVIGPGSYEERLPSYLGAILWMHGGMGLAMTAIFATSAAVLSAADGRLSPAMAAMSMAAPCILLFWLFRRACYLTGRPFLAVKGSSLYAAVLLCGLGCLRVSERVSAGSVFLLMGAASVVASLSFLRGLGVRLPDLVGPRPCACLREAIIRHWAYARWSLATTVMYWMASSVYLPLVGMLAGLPAVASYRAAENLLLPMNQTLTALGLLLLPWLSKQNIVRGRGYLRATAVKVALLASCMAGLYALAALIAGPWLIGSVYGDQYSSCLKIIPYLGATLVLRAIGDTGFGIASRAAGRPDLLFWTTAASAVATLTVGLGLVRRSGAVGAAVGCLASSAVSCILSTCLFCWRVR
jgi:O-antigen/teichoic acid export membrane protein